MTAHVQDWHFLKMPSGENVLRILSQSGGTVSVPWMPCPAAKSNSKQGICSQGSETHCKGSGVGGHHTTGSGLRIGGSSRRMGGQTCPRPPKPSIARSLQHTPSGSPLQLQAASAGSKQGPAGQTAMSSWVGWAGGRTKLQVMIASSATAPEFPSNPSSVTKNSRQAFTLV